MLLSALVEDPLESEEDEEEFESVGVESLEEELFEVSVEEEDEEEDEEEFELLLLLSDSNPKKTAKKLGPKSPHM